jgi:fermentation-respiration switch protein FrsA (DUF1100 family)
LTEHGSRDVIGYVAIDRWPVSNLYRAGMVRFVAILVAFLALASILAASVFFGQRSVLFPAPAFTHEPLRDSAAVVSLSTGAQALFLAPTAGESNPAPLIIFMHGNAELADHWVAQFGEPRSWGWAALLLEYPGYGRSAGKPSEESIISAAGAAYDWAGQDPRVDPSRIVAYGRSLGGGPAAWLAANRTPSAVILESAFTGTRPLAARYWIPGLFVRDPFDNLSALRRYRGPLLVVHGRHDSIVPIAHGRALAAAVHGAEFQELDCGHNDCSRPWARVRTFLLAQGLMASTAGRPR